MKRCPGCTTEYDAVDWTCPTCRYEPEIREGIPILAPELEKEGAAFPSEAFAELAALEAGNFWFRARNELIAWALQRCFPGTQDYLEIGCGTGYVLARVAQELPKARLIGSEVFSSALSIAASRVASADFIQMDARRLPYTEAFDVVGAFDVLEHIQEDGDVLAEMFRVLRPGGGIIVTVPQHPWLWSAEDEYARHVRRYRRGELREKVSLAGFEVELETSFVTLLLPAMFASRASRRNSDRKAHALTELRLHPVIDRTLEGIMNLERRLIRIGLSFPLGGSLLLVARKSEVIARRTHSSRRFPPGVGSRQSVR